MLRYFFALSLLSFVCLATDNIGAINSARVDVTRVFLKKDRLNYAYRDLYRVIVSGLTLYADKDTMESWFPDELQLAIAEVEILCDKLTIDAPMLLPGAHLSIKAREIEFGENGKIITKPMSSISILNDIEESYVEEDEEMRNGEDGGSISILADTMLVYNDESPLLWMSGDDGKGTQPEEECVYYDGQQLNYINYITEFALLHTYPLVVCVKDADGKVLMGKETDRHVFEKPPERRRTGNGGSGGNLETNIPQLQKETGGVSSLVSNKAGKPGLPRPCPRGNSCGPHDPDCRVSAEITVYDRDEGIVNVDLMSRRPKPAPLTPVGKMGFDGRSRNTTDYAWLDEKVAKGVLNSFPRIFPPKTEEKETALVYAQTIKACFDANSDKESIFAADFSSSPCTADDDARSRFEFLLKRFTAVAAK